MKITCIGDIHGRKNWKSIVKKNENSDIFVFLGDYVDPYVFERISEKVALANFKEIINFKKQSPDKVVLLIGNHDAQYLYYPRFRTGALCKTNLQDTILTFQNNRDLFEFGYQNGKYLFTHAGISNGWFNKYNRLFDSFGLNSDFSNFGEVLNKVGQDIGLIPIFENTSKFRGGSDEYGSSLWSDKNELYDDYLIGVHQIVGHNKFQDIMKFGDDDSSITFIDCLWSKTEALILEV